MKITGIDYERLFSLGQYENERIALHADVDETDNVIDVFKDLKATVLSLHEEGKLLEESKKVAEATEPKEAKTTVPEKNFDLTYIKHTGAKLGEFEIADEKDSPTDLYEHALDILKQNKATISDRYHGEGYVYGYWEYQGKIWRKKLKK